MSWLKLKTYRFELVKDREMDTITIQARGYKDAQKKLSESGYSLSYGNWMIKRLEIKPIAQ